MYRLSTIVNMIISLSYKIYSPFQRKNKYSILYYHSVIPSISATSAQFNPHVAISEDLFASQMRYLAENTTVLSIGEFLEHLLSDKPFPVNSVVITFDDGYADNYRVAFPILRKHSLPATIFLSTDMVGTAKRFWWDELQNCFLQVESSAQLIDFAEETKWSVPFDREDRRQLIQRSTPISAYYAILNERLKYADTSLRDKFINDLDRFLNIQKDRNQRQVLSWEEVIEMSRHNISFGSHSCSHINVKTATEEAISEELNRSKKMIEKNTGMETATFSYPYGIYTNQCQEILEKAGYRAAFVTDHPDAVQLPFLIPRAQVKEGTSRGLNRSPSDLLFAAQYTGYLKSVKYRAKKLAAPFIR